MKCTKAREKKGGGYDEPTQKIMDKMVGFIYFNFKQHCAKISISLHMKRSHIIINLSYFVGYIKKRSSGWELNDRRK